MSSNGTGSTNFGLFLPPNQIIPESGSWAASVINICDSRATFALRCTAGPSSATPVCGSNAPTITVTEGVSDFRFATETSMSGTSVSVSQTCKITSSSKAVCKEHYTVKADGHKTHSHVTAKFTDSAEYNAHVYPLTFVGGAANLTSGKACSKKSSSGGSVTKPNGVLFTSAVALFGALAVFAM